MSSKTLRSVVLMLSLLPALAFAEDAKARAAREELERELQGMVGKVPTRVRIEYAEVDDPNYVLQEAVFELDGKGLLSPPPGALSMADEKILVWQGDVTPGKHVVTVRLKYKNTASPIVAAEGGREWTLSGDRSFEQQAGIEVFVLAKTIVDPKAVAVEKRLTLSLPASPKMIAKLDDGSIPNAPPKPVLDAGPTAEELAAAKKAEEDEKKRLATEAAAAEAKRKADEAAEAKLAATNAPTNAPTNTPTKTPTSEPTARPVPVAPSPVAAAEPVVVDAGAPVAVAPPPVVDAGVPLADTPPDEEGSFPWIVVVIGGAIGVIVAIVIARRRSRPPTLHD
ncbi:MAG: hypothetical protein DI536_24625 [Archangium gephyra]|uniref:Uncharacterized protein n=1 Tax=Archangium gephyra TaxID=48 RepID=A0A2W5SZE4_9BACT|nr:MAG: hypothetical protein DI536_24625 [Archangium gephyra]